ncbi:hypothetical protein OPQ81_000914 [Rhizoctonia solani]|nr:hypothetical protein OPQ81_000914 [Rhizoctonia solani]
MFRPYIPEPSPSDVPVTAIAGHPQHPILKLLVPGGAECTTCLAEECAYNPSYRMPAYQRRNLISDVVVVHVLSARPPHPLLRPSGTLLFCDSSASTACAPTAPVPIRLDLLFVGCFRFNIFRSLLLVLSKHCPYLRHTQPALQPFQRSNRSLCCFSEHRITQFGTIIRIDWVTFLIFSSSKKIRLYYH